MMGNQWTVYCWNACSTVLNPQSLLILVEVQYNFVTMDSIIMDYPLLQTYCLFLAESVSISVCDGTVKMDFDNMDFRLLACRESSRHRLISMLDTAIFMMWHLLVR